MDGRQEQRVRKGILLRRYDVMVMMVIVITKVRLVSDEKHINDIMMIINAGAAPWQ